MSKRPRWTENEYQFIRENSGTMRDEDMAKKLSEITGRHIGVQSVRKQRAKLNIKKERGRGIVRLIQSNNTIPNN